jgi:hypothetical protein
VGACGHVLSCQAVNAAASRDPGVGKAYPILKTPEWSDGMSGLVSGRGGRRAERTGGEILPAHDYRNGKTMAWNIPKFSSF